MLWGAAFVTADVLLSHQTSFRAALFPPVEMARVLLVTCPMDFL